jgi:ubiquinone/menaquinone biosynthesis C-methylase UbiE
MKKEQKSASQLHENVPPDWYYRSIRENIFQRFWHKKRFEEVSRLLEPVKGKILDVGSADGVFTKVILDKTDARKIIGIDVLKESVDWAKKHWKKNKRLEFRVADAHELPFKASTFDAAVCLEVLEHVFEPLQVLKEIKRVLKKGGYAVFLVPSENFLFRFIWFLWGFWRGKIWQDTHIHTYRNNYLLALNQKAGLEVIEDKKFLLGMLHAVKAIKV